MKPQRSFAFLVLGLILAFTTCFVFSIPVAAQPVTAQTHSLESSTYNSIQVHSVSQRVRQTICYQAHVQNIGWQSSVCNGQTAGTTGQSLRMEAIQISLVNASRGERVCYQAYVQNTGWQSPVCNGQTAGTTGQSLRMEAIRVWLSTYRNPSRR